MPSKKPIKTKDEFSVDIYQKIRSAQKEAYNDLLEFCIKIEPQNDEATYMSYGADFANSSNKVFHEIDLFKSRVSTFPLLSVILLWARNSSMDKVFGARHIMIMQELLKNKLIQYRYSGSDELVKIAEFAGLGHFPIIERIRCYKEWSIEKREDYVKFYVEFANWLSEASFGFIQKAIDPDRAITANRWLPFDLYVTIIKELADRERALAKIFYLGGARSLEEVLSLKIEDIDFKQHALYIVKEAVRYPKHLFEDLREYINDRKNGYVFIGRHGDRIDHTVPYRALKTVTSKLKLDSSFTFKDFVKNL